MDLEEFEAAVFAGASCLSAANDTEYSHDWGRDSSRRHQQSLLTLPCFER